MKLHSILSLTLFCLLLSAQFAFGDIKDKLSVHYQRKRRGKEALIPFGVPQASR